MEMRDVGAGDYGCQPIATLGRRRPGVVVGEIGESRRRVGRSGAVATPCTVLGVYQDGPIQKGRWNGAAAKEEC